MIKEAIEAIASLTRAEKTLPEWKQIALPGNRTAYVDHSGETKELANDKPARNHELNDIDSFIGAVNSYAGGCSVFINHYHAVAVLDDDGYSRDKVSLPLVPSVLFERLSKFPETMKQKQLIRFCRQYLEPGLPFLQAIRNIDFNRESTGKASREHGRETLGQSVEMAVRGREEIPESFTVPVCPFAIAGFKATYPVRVIVEIEVEEQQFWLGCGPDELAIVQQQAVADLAGMLESGLNDIPVYVGSP